MSADVDMPLTRKTRVAGSSIVLTIPSQLVEAYDINDGDELEIIPLKHGELKIRKAKIDDRGRILREQHR